MNKEQEKLLMHVMKVGLVAEDLLKKHRAKLVKESKEAIKTIRRFKGNNLGQGYQPTGTNKHNIKPPPRKP